MPLAGDTLRVEGLRDFQRALKVADAELSKEFRVRLRKVAEPVRADAERLALAGIPKIGIPWSRMRVGVTQTTVYVAPKQRGSRGRTGRHRPNLFDLLLGRSLDPALDMNEPRIRAEFEDLLVDVARKWERV